jgi:hypothetical protein
MLITTPHTCMHVFISRKKNTPDSSSTRNSTTWLTVSKIWPPIIVGYPTCRCIFDGPAQLDGCITHVFTKTSEISMCYSTNCLDNLPASEWLVMNGLGVSSTTFWCLLWTLYSISPMCTTLPSPLPNTCYAEMKHRVNSSFTDTDLDFNMACCRVVSFNKNSLIMKQWLGNVDSASTSVPTIILQAILLKLSIILTD